MKIIEAKERTPFLIQQLMKIWEGSVKATHKFLSDKEIEKIKEYVPQALQEISILIILVDETELPAAFMGIDGKKLEMLFVSSEKRGLGLGKVLLQYGIDNYFVNELTVNEQNPLAKGFYEHMGFQVYKRTARDEQGGPYPLLYMQLT